jgi:hypothetical protein
MTSPLEELSSVALQTTMTTTKTKMMRQMVELAGSAVAREAVQAGQHEPAADANDPSEAMKRC